jgi:RND family efflux transporter MFP subunit
VIQQANREFTKSTRRTIMFQPDSRWRGLTAVWLLVPAIAACGREPAPRSAPPRPPLAVHVSRARLVSRTVGEEVVGTVRARNSAVLSPTIAGRVTELRVTLGSRVHEGDLLARISAPEIDARLEQARALFERKEVDLGRAKRLVDDGAIAPTVYDAALTEFHVARGARAEASAMADHTVLRAPFAGVVTSKSANVGDTAMPGQPLLAIEDPGALRLEATLAEGAARALAPGQRVQARIDGVARDLAGTVAEISPVADPASRTVLAKIDLPVDPALRSGLFGRLLLASGESTSLVVPSAAVIHHGQLEAVFVVEGGTAQLRLVRTGRERAGVVEITSGLDDGEAVADSDVGTLADAQPVEALP